MFYYVYVLQSEKDHKFYIEYTNNIIKRKKEHDLGECPSTAWRRPLRLIFYEAYLSQKDALRREDYFKTSKGKKTLRLMLQKFLSEKQE